VVQRPGPLPGAEAAQAPAEAHFSVAPAGRAG
jgi:hypothetical protein